MRPRMRNVNDEWVSPLYPNYVYVASSYRNNHGDVCGTIDVNGKHIPVFQSHESKILKQKY